MKKNLQYKSWLTSSAILFSSALFSIAPSSALAGVSAHAGVVSDYVWRGTKQGINANGKTTQAAAAQAGLDYEHNSGFYTGVWGSTMAGSSGFEYDVYAGWASNLGELDFSIGAVLVNYTDKDFSSDDPDINLVVGYGPVSVNYDVDADDSSSYHYAISVDVMAVTLTYGGTDAADKEYMVASYGFELTKDVNGNFDLISGTKGEGSMMVFGLSKSFNF